MLQARSNIVFSLLRLPMGIQRQRKAFLFFPTVFKVRLHPAKLWLLLMNFKLRKRLTLQYVRTWLSLCPLQIINAVKWPRIVMMLTMLGTETSCFLQSDFPQCSDQVFPVISVYLKAQKIQRRSKGKSNITISTVLIAASNDF